MKVCPECGREHSGSEELCSTCWVRNYIGGVTSRTAPPVKRVSRDTKKVQEPTVVAVEEMLPQGMLYRICLTCGSIYLTKGKGTESTVPCTYCGRVTGFWETTDRFLHYVGTHRIHVDDIKDLRVRAILDTKMILDEEGVYINARN